MLTALLSGRWRISEQKMYELVLHPVRLRIITALHGRKMTPGELAEDLPDVPQATLYRSARQSRTSGIITEKERNDEPKTVPPRAVLCCIGINNTPYPLCHGL